MKHNSLARRGNRVLPAIDWLLTLNLLLWGLLCLGLLGGAIIYLP